ncbi:hypothetical protein H0H93_009382, partial [Arthromyces matolae]
ILLVEAALSSTSFGEQGAESTPIGRVIFIASDVGQAMSLVTNPTATAFIWWILRGHLKTLRRDDNWEGQKLFNVWRILALLVETGAVYGILSIKGASDPKLAMN